MKDQNQDNNTRIGEGIDRLSESVETAMIDISSQVGEATVEISRTMVESARNITKISEQFVRASSKLAMLKAGQRFQGVIEDTTMEHFMALAEKRAGFEEKVATLPEGAAKRFAKQMIKKIETEENDIFEMVSDGGSFLALENKLDQEVNSEIPGTPSIAALSETRGHAFAPPQITDQDAKTEIMSDPVAMEGEAIRPGGSDSLSAKPGLTGG